MTEERRPRWPGAAISLLIGILMALVGLLWHGAALAQELAPVPAQTEAPGVTISILEDTLQTHPPGAKVAIDFEVSNDRDVTDTFLITTIADEHWPIEIVRSNPPTETTELAIQIPAGLTAGLELSVTVPSEASGANPIIITAVSLSNPAIQDAAPLTIVAAVDIYLPVVYRWFPPIPYPPVLNPISNPEQDGIYTVTWQPAQLATSYSLEEDDNAGFSSPTVVYSGMATSWMTPDPGRASGTYYYRVRGLNNVGYGDYSESQTVTVAARFLADVSSLTAGQCTTLRWNFDNVKAVYISFAKGFDKRGVAGSGTFSICPSVTTTYRALVVNQDNSQSNYDFTVNVTGTTCADPYVLRFEPTTYQVNAGERFSIFWDVRCAKAVYYSAGSGAEQPVTGQGSKIDVQIFQDTLFKLRIEYNNRTLSDNASFTVDVR